MLDDMLALANSVCLLALSCSGRYVLTLLLCVRLVAPCCAVFAVDARRQHARTDLRKAHKSKGLEKEGSSKKE